MNTLLVLQFGEIISNVREQLENINWDMARVEGIGVSTTIKRQGEPIAPGLIKALSKLKFHYEIFCWKGGSDGYWTLTASIPKERWMDLMDLPV